MEKNTDNERKRKHSLPQAPADSMTSYSISQYFSDRTRQRTGAGNLSDQQQQPAPNQQPAQLHPATVVGGSSFFSFRRPNADPGGHQEMALGYPERMPTLDVGALETRQRHHAVDRLNAAVSLASISQEAPGVGPVNAGTEDMESVILSETVQPTEAMLAHGLELLEESIQGLPALDKFAYIQARQVAPHLIFRESNPMKYLQHEQFNYWAAARKLAYYWQKRLELFGPDRAFRSLTDFSGEGAFPLDDLIPSMDGSVVFLPNDSEGRTIMLVSLDRLLSSDRDCRLRNVYMFGAMMNHNEVSCIKGHVSMQNIQTKIPDSLVVECAVLMKDAFPTIAKKLHIINNSKSPGIFTQIVVPLVFRVYQALFRSHILRFYDSTEQSEVLRQLADQGINKQSLPKSLGGSIPFEDLIQWRKKLVSPGDQGHLNRPISTLEDDCLTLLTIAMDQIPRHNKVAYTRAVANKGTIQKVLDLTPPLLHFFRSEDFHSLQVAARVANFWQLKSDLFDDDKFLQALDQTGENALDRKELAALGGGFVSLLPNDMSGQAVVCIDLAFLPDGTSPDVRDRCILYIFTVACENKMSPTEGVVVLCVMESDGSTNLGYLGLLGRILESFPIQISDLHLIWPGARPSNPPDTASKEFQLATNAVHVHGRAEPKERLAEVLSRHGLAIQYLPRRLGGSWGHEKFGQWQELRSRIEWRVPGGFSGRINEIGHEFVFPLLIPTADLNDEERTERKRRMNVIHSRRKREKAKLDVAALREEALMLQDENCRLQEENLYLEGLMNTSTAKISRLGRTADP